MIWLPIEHETLKPSLDDLLSRYASVATSQHRKEALTRELLARHDDYVSAQFSHPRLRPLELAFAAKIDHDDF